MTQRGRYAIAAGVLGAVVIFGLYTWRAHSAAGASSDIATTRPVDATMVATPKVVSIEEATARLAARLEKSGGSSGDWRLLGKSYDYLGRKAEAEAAFTRAERMPATSSEPFGGPMASAASGARITGTVDLSLQFKSTAIAGATLFIYAKSAEMHGMPLAALRLPAQGWPLAFTLDDGSAMQPSRNLSSAAWVTVEARISPTGGALAQRGDLIGSVENVAPRKGTPVRIVIDRVVGDRP